MSASMCPAVSDDGVAAARFAAGEEGWWPRLRELYLVRTCAGTRALRDLTSEVYGPASLEVLRLDHPHGGGGSGTTAHYEETFVGQRGGPAGRLRLATCERGGVWDGTR